MYDDFLEWWSVYLVKKKKIYESSDERVLAHPRQSGALSERRPAGWERSPVSCTFYRLSCNTDFLSPVGGALTEWN